MSTSIRSVLVLAFLALGMSRGLADYQHCNSAAMPIDTAVGYAKDGKWISEGWWIVWPGECATVIAGPLRERYYYSYAKVWNHFWTGDPNQAGAEFCVQGPPFKLDQDECANPKNDSILRAPVYCIICSTPGKSIKRCFQRDTGDATSFQTSFGCPGCQLPEVEYNQKTQTAQIRDVVKQNVFGVDVFVKYVNDFIVTKTSNSSLSVSVESDFDLSHLQRKIPSLVGRMTNSLDECGTRINTHSVSIEPWGGKALLKASAEWEQWVCTYADLPQTKCEETWIETDLPFGGSVKTEGLPNCEVWTETVQTSKNMAWSQSGYVAVEVDVEISEAAAVRFTPNVLNVHVDGLGGQIIDLLKVDLANIAQNFLLGALPPDLLEARAPSELRSGLDLQQIHFYDRGAGSLGLKATGKFVLNNQNSLPLCKKFWPAGQCQPQ